ncbi:MAG: CNP1-like family protein, partial [Paracoccaceae bacterium]
RYVSLKLGVDPDTLRVTDDGIVRYVVVATSPSGNVNASYEGIRCQTGQVKVYARHGATGSWRAIEDPQWKPLRDNQPSLHALAIAHQGVCDGRAPSSRSASAIIANLKRPMLDDK